jgi:two-component system CheB/CheR fusion protein
MFINLLRNSLKFSKPDIPPNIKISSRITTAQESRIKTYTLPSNAKFEQIEIADNGIGFEQEYGEKIFDVFERLNGYDDYPGSGIGLSAVKKIIDNHRGNISVKSNLNEGATFRILLPME